VYAILSAMRKGNILDLKARLNQYIYSLKEAIVKSIKNLLTIASFSMCYLITLIK